VVDVPPNLSRCGEYLPAEKRETLDALDYIGKLKDDWNGFGAKAPTSTSLISAQQLVERLPLNFAFPDRVAPDGEGAVMLIWEWDAVLLIATVDASQIHLSRTGKTGAPDLFKDGIPFDGEFVPSLLKQELPLRQTASVYPA
jgi:hypothetical protein